MTWGNSLLLKLGFDRRKDMQRRKEFKARLNETQVLNTQLKEQRKKTNTAIGNLLDQLSHKEHTHV